jgi:hypothetical protein
MIRRIHMNLVNSVNPVILSKLDRISMMRRIYTSLVNSVNPVILSNG